MARSSRSSRVRSGRSSNDYAGDLDAIARNHTAFGSYRAVVAACQSGYAPTLARRGATEVLGLALESDGYRVFWRR